MTPDFQVGIIGAGFAGLVAALRLKKSGRESFVIFERNSAVGGTWRDNTYPGCACDVASPLYSFADEPKPDWSQLYSGQPEILRYMNDVVDKNRLHHHIRFNTDIVEARFLKKNGCWQITDQQGKVVLVQMLLVGMGPLNRPHIPDFAGLSSFRGRHFHSSSWDHSFDLKGKRVAVIGTGASAIQIVPSIAPDVSQLLVLQRTPAWVSHRFDRKISPFSKWLHKQFPLLLRLRRELIYWTNELIGLSFMGNRLLNKLMKQIALHKLKNEVKDPETRKKLTPTYTIGCKRILRSDDYYPAFNRANVQLLTTPIAEFTERGLRTADGKEHLLDAVVFATGFVAADFTIYTKLIGLKERNLIDEWKQTGAEAYKGTTVAGYPNLAFLLGPNTGLGHNSVVHMMESQMNYIMHYINYLAAATPASFLDVRKEVQQHYNQQLQKQLKDTVWASGCKSWYVNAAGKNTTLYPRLTVNFRKKTKVFDPAAYQLLSPTEPAAYSPTATAVN